MQKFGSASIYRRIVAKVNDMQSESEQIAFLVSFAAIHAQSAREYFNAHDIVRFSVERGVALFCLTIVQQLHDSSGRMLINQ